MLPYQYLSKIGIYNVSVNDFNVKVRVVDNLSVVELGLSELRSQIKTPNVVGIAYRNNASLLVLCAGSYCLVFQLCIFESQKSLDSLMKFFKVADYCLVASSNSARIYIVNTFVENVVDIAELAAKILRKPSLLGNTSIGAVAAAVGLPFENSPDGAKMSGISRVLSQVQVECLAREAHMAYLAGKKLLESL